MSKTNRIEHKKEEEEEEEHKGKNQRTTQTHIRHREYL